MRQRLASIAVMLTTAGCVAEGGEPDEPAPIEYRPGARTGDVGCDIVIESYQACLEHAPIQFRERITTNLEAAFTQWLQLADMKRSGKWTEGLGYACDRAIAAWQRTAVVLGCEVPNPGAAAQSGIDQSIGG